MRCPVCHITLTTAERFGVEIDYCPKCWGVWLDRGELNVLLKRHETQDEKASDPLIEAPYDPDSIQHPDPEASFGSVDDFTWKAYVDKR